MPGEALYILTCTDVTRNTVSNDAALTAVFKFSKYWKICLLVVHAGPYVRYGPNRLLIDTNTAANGNTSPFLEATFFVCPLTRLSDRKSGTDINSHKANTIKSKAYQALVHSAPNTLTIRDKSDHSRRRRILSLAFSEAKIQSYENILLRHINNFCSAIGTRDDKTSPDSSRDMALYSKSDPLPPVERIRKV